MTGAEPAYDPALWNSKKNIRETHNCFSYAMNVHDPKQIEACHTTKDCYVPFHQPGYAANHDNFQDSKLKTCPKMLGRIFGDNPSIERASLQKGHLIQFHQRCPSATSKIAIVVDPDEDYHFYRQDSNGMWSHKPGGTAVTNKDASGRPIYNPALCDRNYNEKSSKLNYDVFCSFFCVPRMKELTLKSESKHRTRFVKTRRNMARGGKRRTRCRH